MGKVEGRKTFLGVGGRADSFEIILTLIEQGRGLIRHNEDRGRWVTVVTTVMNI